MTFICSTNQAWLRNSRAYYRWCLTLLPEGALQIWKATMPCQCTVILRVPEKSCLWSPSHVGWAKEEPSHGVAGQPLRCSPLTQKAPCQHAKSPESSGPPGILRLAEFQSYTRGLIFQADFPPSQRLPENISLPLKVRALETGSKFRIVYLAPEPELVILNWAIGLSIFAALPHQFK